MPVLLDLFCGAGGAAVGYYRAGFEVVGVDLVPQPHYPFEFHQADALEYCAAYGKGFDIIHASPPCQGYSRTRHIFKTGKTYPLLIETVRDLLWSSGAEYIIENVPGAPLKNALVLDGRMFGLTVFRKRLFETSRFILAPPMPPNNRRKMVADISEYDRGQYGFISVYGRRFSVPVASVAMGIDWMTRDELAQAIPPSYTEFIGRQLLRR
jgi:DNA (cytosine-5)-methyltransferase 1